jgi:hypothetical protein
VIVIVAYTVTKPALVELKNAKNRSERRTMRTGLSHTLAADDHQQHSPTDEHGRDRRMHFLVIRGFDTDRQAAGFEAMLLAHRDRDEE